MRKIVEKNITILVPSRVYDNNLHLCITQIRNFYKNIKIFLVLDKTTNFKKDKNIKIIISGNKSIGFKRNLGMKHVKTKFVSFIDSDAYPKTEWLNNAINFFKDKTVAAVGGPNISPKTNNIEKILVARSRKNSIVTLNNKVKSRKTKKYFIDFLPSCNMIVRTKTYKQLNGMDSRLYSGEEVSLNYKINKNGFKMIFCPTIWVYHQDRNFKHFTRQRFIYGSTGLWLSLRYPCKESFMLFISNFPLLYILIFPIIFINEWISLIYKSGIFLLFSLVLINSLKINFKNNFLKSLRLSLISIFVPGFGLLASLLFKKEKIKEFYTQK